MLIAAIAATTRRIRVGSAGVMLPHYSRLKVAEQFRVLEAIAPGRIDLGLGRAPGSDGRTAYALNPQADDARPTISRRRCATCWPGSPGEQLLEGHPFRDIRAQPPGRPCRRCGFSAAPTTARRSRRYFGLPYCFAHFITDGRGAEQALALYRQNYRPSARHPEPHAAALRLGAGRRHRGGGRAPVHLARDRGGSAATAASSRRCPPPRRPPPSRSAKASGRGSPGCANAPSTAPPPRSARGCGRWRQEQELSEIAVLTTVHDPVARRRSYTLLAEEFGLDDGLKSALHSEP